MFLLYTVKNLLLNRHPPSCLSYIQSKFCFLIDRCHKLLTNRDTRRIYRRPIIITNKPEYPQNISPTCHKLLTNRSTRRISPTCHKSLTKRNNLRISPTYDKSQTTLSTCKMLLSCHKSLTNRNTFRRSPTCHKSLTN